MIRRKLLGLSTHAWGEASVLATEIKLFYEGYQVYKPLVDESGIDLIVLNGNRAARIQVKASSLITKDRADGSRVQYYEFNLASVRARYSGPAEVKLRNFSEEVEFVVLHGVDEDKFWIVPAHLLDGKKTATIYTTSRSRLDIDWEDIQKRREAGETFQSLGNSVGISASAVLERLRGSTKEAGSKLVNQLRACENDWDSIDRFFEASSASGVEPHKDNEGQ